MGEHSRPLATAPAKTYAQVGLGMFHKDCNYHHKWGKHALLLTRSMDMLWLSSSSSSTSSRAVIAVAISTTFHRWFCLACWLAIGHHLLQRSKIPWWNKAVKGHSTICNRWAQMCYHSSRRLQLFSWGCSMEQSEYVWDVTFCPSISWANMNRLSQFRTKPVVLCPLKSQYLYS